MASRLKWIYGQLGRTEKLFLVALLICAILSLTPQGSPDLLRIAVYVLAVIVAVRLARKARILWRLRNRLIVAYLFIAVVPVVLILVLVAISAYVITGQIAGYMVSSELERRTFGLAIPAEMLARTAPAARPDVLKRWEPQIRRRFADFELMIRDSGVPPAGWKNTHGVVFKDSRLFAWAHAIQNGSEVTLLAPVTHDFLAELVPELGEVFFLDFGVLSAEHPRGPRKPFRLDETRGPHRNRIPPKHNQFDVLVTGGSPMPVASWGTPGENRSGLLGVRTRPSAVLRIVFAQKLEWAQGLLLAFTLVGTLFFVVELISLIIGVSITRTITRAVHNLYGGTQRVIQGDFSHRIEVHGNDQLAELGTSFNHMTENLQRLILVEKEKERLQSELEIAREVQNQLFPKNVPTLQTLELTGVCNPARMVSGDYYDFLCLADSMLALAIGDVAGKGISAALLMAAIQSAMRTQLSAGVPAAVAAGMGASNGGGRHAFSTAHLVSQLNKQLYANTAPEKYASFYFGLYDESTNILTYTNAGHLPPILVRNGEPQFLEVTGTVVGAFPFSKYEEKNITLYRGDLLVAYTDGITEPENEYGEMFGENRLQDLVVKYASEDSPGLIARVMESVQHWTGSSELQDDMTMLVVRRI